MDEVNSEEQEKKKVYCPKCGSDRVGRRPRDGFWQEGPLSLLGLYPWECRECRRNLILWRRWKDEHQMAEDRKRREQFNRPSASK